jgi:hypothetical protein
VCDFVERVVGNVYDRLYLVIKFGVAFLYTTIHPNAYCVFINMFFY